MKKLNILASMFVGLALLAACEDDKDSNPVIQQPTTFVLNTPAYAASNAYDLVNSKSIQLTCTQPDYGYTAIVTYSVQVSLNENFKEATATEEANYQVLPTTTTIAKMDVSAEELDKAVVKLAGWTSEEECSGDAMEIWVRLNAKVGKDIYPINSNPVKLTVLPYYIELKDAVPVTYYLLGDCIGDGKWTNDAGALGISLIPMSLVADYEYDKVTGKGEFVYTGYFPADKGFKIVGNVGSWDEQWGNAGAPGFDNLVHNDGGSQNITVKEAGWYTVTLDTKVNKLTVVKCKDQKNPTEYESMELVGTFEGWATAPLAMTKTGGEHSHVWYADVTFDQDADVKKDPSNPEGCKFRANGGWDISWGGVGFPFALSATTNIPYKAGSYRVIFNELNGSYYFIAKAE